MTEVGSADLSRLLQSKRNECSTIVTTRKRKLRELFAVATHVDSLPHDALANPDAPTTTPAEWQFLQANDIVQGKTFNEQYIPPRPQLSLDILRSSLYKSLLAVNKEQSSGNANKDQREKLSEDNGERVNGTTDVKDAQDGGTTPMDTSLDGSAESMTAAVVNKPGQPSPQTQQTVEKPTTKSPKPDAVSTTTTQPTAMAQPLNGESHSTTTPGDSTRRRSVQVTFPPGTKGSPSESKNAGQGVEKQILSEAIGTANHGRGSDGGNAQGSVPLSIKPPNEVSRVPEAMSSPGSTAVSATTPAVHDVSTDTSPDKEVSQYIPSVEEKSESMEDESIDSTEDVDAFAQSDQASNPPPNSAEAQLLEESTRSSAAAAASAAVTSIKETVLESSNEASSHVAKEPKVSEEVKPSPPVATPRDDDEEANKENKPNQLDQSTKMPPKEIRDSEDDDADRMDVDTPEELDSRKNSDASLVQQNQKIASQEASPTSTLPKPQKENSHVPERAVTRVSSGAMRLKSVSEIVGDTPRGTPTLERSFTHKSIDDQLTPLTSTPQSPFSRQKNMLSHRRERSKSQLPSAVVFGKQPKRVEEKAVIPGQKETVSPSDDYYTPLFVQGFTGSSSWMQPIEKVLFTANKTVATPDANLAIQDHQACKVLRRVYHLQQHDKWSLRQPKRRVYHLQQHDKWSLRQPKRCPEPTRPPSQWDVLLKEVKWMRTDFREERKWKMAVAKNLAYACADWVMASPEERKLIQVPAVIPPKSGGVNDVAMPDADTRDDAAESQSTPDLIPSAEVDSPAHGDDLAEDFADTVAPSAIFALHDDDVVFGLKRTPAADQLLEELPMYGAPLTVPKFDLTGPEYDPDAHWRRPALPLSKYVEGQMKLITPGPPKKKSRFDYSNDESEDEGDSVFVGHAHTPHTTSAPLPPQTSEVALFNADMKPIRDRLHAGHQFRPPSEHPMPTQNFYECRNPSQWTVAEDDELRSLVREYSYNWSLISSLLTTRSLFSSGAERRSPWECFERWINLEGLPADMQKTQYFKAYNSRIESAQRVIMQQNQLAAQQASAAGGAVAPVRRRPSTPLRVERRRNQKHLTLIDAMRKLAKKRESAIQKQQHNASQNAANKKPNDAVAQRPTKTPRDYSLLRWERDQALAEKMAQYAQRQEAQRRAALQARAQGQVPQMVGAAAGANGAHPPGVNGVNGVGGRMPVSNQVTAAVAAAAAAGRPRPPMSVPPNGMGAVPNHMAGGLVPPGQNNIPQAQMQAMQGQQHRMPMPNPQPDVNLMMQARRISEQQRVAVQQQLQQGQNPATPGINGAQQNVANIRTAMNGMTQQNFINNAQAMMASLNAGQNGHGTPPANGLHMPTGAAGSPGARPTPQLPPSIANQLAQLENQFRAKNPNITPEQARTLATEHLTRAMMAQRQSAMSAAAGSNGQPGITNSIAATTSPHQYAALLRQKQQQASQAAGSPAPQHQPQHVLQRQQSQPAGSPAQQHQLPIQRQASQSSASPQQHQQHPVPRPQQPQPQQHPPTPQQQQQQQPHKQPPPTPTPQPQPQPQQQQQQQGGQVQQQAQQTPRPQQQPQPQPQPQPQVQPQVQPQAQPQQQQQQQKRQQTPQPQPQPQPQSQTQSQPQQVQQQSQQKLAGSPQAQSQQAQTPAQAQVQAQAQAQAQQQQQQQRQASGSATPSVGK